MSRAFLKKSVLIIDIWIILEAYCNPYGIHMIYSKLCIPYVHLCITLPIVVGRATTDEKTEERTEDRKRRQPTRHLARSCD